MNQVSFRKKSNPPSSWSNEDDSHVVPELTLSCPHSPDQSRATNANLTGGCCAGSRHLARTPRDTLSQRTSQIVSSPAPGTDDILKRYRCGIIVDDSSPRAFAAAILQAFAQQNVANGDRVNVRIGLHAGEAVKENDDFFGKNVILASRVAGHAKGEEILVSSVVRSLVESSVDAAIFGDAREVSLKGLEGAHTVHVVRWQ